MTTQILYFGRKVIVEMNQVDLLHQKEAAVNALVDMDKQMNNHGGVVDMIKLKRLQSKIIRLNKKISQSV